MANRRAVEILIKILGAKNVETALKDVSRAEDRVGTTAERSSKKTGALGGALKSVAASAKSFILGFVGLTAVIGLFSKLYNHIKNVRDILKQLAEQAATTQSSLRELAEQERISLQEAARRTQQTVQRTGATTEVAAEARRAVHSAFGEAGIAGGVQVPVAGALARYGGGKEQATAMVEFLKRIGAGDRAAAGKALSGIERGMALTFYSSLGEMTQAAGKGQMQGLIAEAPLEEIVGRMAQARAATSTANESAELMKQINRVIQSDKGIALIERHTGREFVGMDYSERIAAFQGALQGAGRRERFGMLREFTGRPRMQAETFFLTKPAVGTYYQALRAVGAGTAAELEARNRAYRGTAPAQLAMVQARTQLDVAAMSDYEVAKGLRRKAAMTELERLKGAGAIGFIDDATQFQETQIRAAEYAVELKRLDVSPSVTPGQIGSADILREQLYQEKTARGIRDEKRQIGTRGGGYMGAGASGIKETVFSGTPDIVGEGGMVIHVHGDAYLNERNISQLPKDAPR
jgi:hypothetical protein